MIAMVRSVLFMWPFLDPGEMWPARAGGRNSRASEGMARKSRAPALRTQVFGGVRGAWTFEVTGDVFGPGVFTGPGAGTLVQAPAIAAVWLMARKVL
jgi:hypothetical protein